MDSMMGGQAVGSGDAELLETVELEHVPETYTVLLGLFRDVSNADFLRKQLLARNAEFEYAFIDASTVSSICLQCFASPNLRPGGLELTVAKIISRVHLLAAVFKGINALVTGSLRTPNVHSEIVTSLSASNSVHNLTHLASRGGVNVKQGAVLTLF